MNPIFILLDFETTGLDPLKNNRIVQLACMLIRIKNKKEISFNNIINPNIPVSKYSKASLIHKIPMQKLKTASSFDTVFLELLDWIQFQKKREDADKVILCAHNGFDFDFNFLTTEIVRYNLENKINLDLYLSDSLIIFRKWFHDFENHKLGYIYEKVRNKKLDGAHNAIVDVNAMRKIITSYNNNQVNKLGIYYLEKDMIDKCALKDLKEEINLAKNKINFMKINLNPEIFYINSTYDERDIIKKDKGKWDDIQRLYYYKSKYDFDNATIKNRFLF